MNDSSGKSKSQAPVYTGRTSAITDKKIVEGIFSEINLGLSFSRVKGEGLYVCTTNPPLYKATEDGEFWKGTDGSALPVEGLGRTKEEAADNLFFSALKAGQGEYPDGQDRYLTYSAGMRRPAIRTEGKRFVDQNPVEKYITRPEMTATKWSVMTDAQLAEMVGDKPGIAEASPSQG